MGRGLSTEQQPQGQGNVATTARNGGAEHALIGKMLVRNFKCIESAEWLDLGRLTALTGVNSSGKTSMLQCLLLLKQTLSDPNRSAVLKLNGPLVRLGAFRDIVSRGDTSKCITIGLELDVKARDLLRSRTMMRWHNTMGSSKGRCRFAVSFGVGDDGTDVRVSGAEVSLTGFRFSGTSPVRMDDLSVMDVGKRDMWIRYERHGRRHRVLFNSPHAVSMPMIFEENGKSPESFRNADGLYRLEGIGGRLYGFVPVSLEVPEVALLREASSGIARGIGSTFGVALNPFSAVSSALDRCFDSMSYIGPLREEPKRFYFRDEGRVLDIGTKGEYAAQILSLEADTEVRNVRDVNCRYRRRERLGAAVDYWLRDRMGMASGVSVEPLSTELPIYDVRVSSMEHRSEKASILNVGFGMSQVLPVIVEGLRTQPGNALILEQPEIHLHPKIQADLADFLMSLAMDGRQILVETHSDHLMNRIRRRLSEDESDRIRGLLRVYFAELTPDGAKFTLMDFDEFGCVQTWPEGFFDQADIENEALLKNQFRKMDKRGRKR